MGYEPTDPEYDVLELPIRRVRHPAVGEVDVKVDFNCTVLVNGAPVMETLELIKLKVAEALTAFATEFT